MKVISINILDNRMTEITVAKRFLFFLWKLTVYRSWEVKIPFETWEWYDMTNMKKVVEPSEYWELDEWTRGDRI